MPTSSQRARFSVTDRPVTVQLTIQAMNTWDRQLPKRCLAAMTSLSADFC